jgi:CheY-like chemotaxis protein
MAEATRPDGDDALARLAHEVRSALAAIRHATEVARMPSATEEQVRWSQEMTERQVDHMSRLIDNIMAVATPARVAPESPAEREPAGEDRLRVLVADDNRDNADSFSTLLTMIGHDVRTAYSGLEAVAVADVFRPQVVVLDIAMPGANGYEVARRIRGRSWGVNAVLIAVTGWGHDDDKRKAEEAGFDHHLVKPVDLQQLEPLMKARSPT